MAQVIIGRDAEKKILQEMLSSGEAELIAISGRRRIGKTFLIRNYYEKHLIFEYTGVHEAGLEGQLLNFRNALQQAMCSTIPPATPAKWIEAFTFLSELLKGKLTTEPVVVLFDEFPWIHTPRSGFLSAFGHWWNTWASRQALLKVVICGSAASWMIENIINNRGGLHNRVSRAIRLLPFSLKETEEYLISRGIRLNHYPNAIQHEAIVRALAKKGGGLSRTEIIETCGFTTGGAVYTEASAWRYIGKNKVFKTQSKRGRRSSLQ